MSASGHVAVISTAGIRSGGRGRGRGARPAAERHGPDAHPAIVGGRAGPVLVAQPPCAGECEPSDRCRSSELELYL